MGHLHPEAQACPVLSILSHLGRCALWCAADALREQGVAHVVYYEAGRVPAPNAQHVAHFSHAFFATLRNKSATVPEVC